MSNSWSRWILAGLLFTVPAVRAQVQPVTIDDDYARLAGDVPGFGGLYLDTAGTTHVYLQDLSRAPEVQGLGDHVVVEQGQYDFRDLLAWKAVLRAQLTERGAVYLDIDETRNRLVFGVEPGSVSAFSAGLSRFLSGTRVPPAAVIVEAADPISPHVQLTDKIRPVPGGVQIQSSVGFCTLGFNTTRAGVRGFVTNSHCTAQRGLVEGTVFSQSTISGSSNVVAVETVDPPFFTGSPCPAGRLCRLSDAVFAAYTSSSLSQGGQIANPVNCPFGVPGSLTVSSTLPRLPVPSFLIASPAAGSVIAKSGRTTGCTFAFLANTCADVNVTGTSITMICQNVASGLDAPGDSGSPVFLHGGTKATLSGVLWGGSAGKWVYSLWYFVFLELGGVIPDAP